MAGMKEHQVYQGGDRLDKHLHGLYGSDYSRSQLQDFIKDGRVTVNGQGQKANYKVSTGDVIVVDFPEEEKLVLVAEDLDLDIVYEDEDLAVINKPSGMVVHPSLGHETGTLVNGLVHRFGDQLSDLGGEFRQGIVHRLDKDTSGLLVIAKTNAAHESLQDQFQKREPLREYVALVHGQMANEAGKIDAPIGRNPKDRKLYAVVRDGKEAISHFKTLKIFKDYSLVQVRLETGRTHQIRVHMKFIHHPVAGDELYGPRKTLKGHGQYLHAGKIAFRHPSTGETLTFEAPIPEYFQQSLEDLEAAHKHS